MDIQELNNPIYQDEKIDTECKKEETGVTQSAYESYVASANTMNSEQ